MSTHVIKNYRTDIKIVVVGNSGTGKTSFCSRWIKGIFSEIYKATVMSDFSFKIYEYKGNTYKIQFWDIAGQDKNVYTSKIFTKNAHGSIVLYDATNPDTLKETLKWKKAIDENTKFVDGDYLPSVLIQNKIDLIDEDQIKNDQEGRNFAEQNQFINFFKTSCKTGVGVEECMDFMIKAIIDRLEEYSKNTNTPIEKDNRTSIVQKPRTETTSMLNSKQNCC